MDVTDMQALIFDVFGTVVDWRSSIISVHDKSATCVPRPLPADLWAIVEAWESLPDAMKAGMEAMVRAARP